MATAVRGASDEGVVMIPKGIFASEKCEDAGIGSQLLAMLLLAGVGGVGFGVGRFSEHDVEFVLEVSLSSYYRSHIGGC